MKYNSLSVSIVVAILSFVYSAPSVIAQQSTQNNPTIEADKNVLVAEIVVSGIEGKLQSEIYKTLQTQPGKTTTRTQIQADINAIFATGYFANVKVISEDTPLGVRITFQVQPNPVLRAVQLSGSQVLPAKVVNESFKNDYGSILNFRQLTEGIKKLNKWYQDNGFVIAQVLDNPSISSDGTVTLQVAEGVIEDIQVQFINENGESTDETGKPVPGRTQKYIITREMQLKPGQIFNRSQFCPSKRRISVSSNIFSQWRLVFRCSYRFWHC